MTTARDLTLIALGLPAGHSVEQGDLSLALAGAEAVDLLDHGALTLDGDRLVPGPPVETGDALLDQAAAALSPQEPYETVDAWLWRRGSELAAAYADDLKRAGLLTHRTGHGLHLPFSAATQTGSPADSPARRAAEERRTSGEPVLTALLVAAGVGDAPSDIPDSPLEDAVTTVLAAVGDAVTQLEAVRLRQGIEDAAFDNVWRGY
ncbi:GPP34 family phosphoprotein [Streptomyces sp. NPDC090106]|uniref:GPP34 family phosphoprotein n=1 Tax=Streptomyces sp. NPDC090106 TaxID=3365946 RepID=UPI0037F35BE6